MKGLLSNFLPQAIRTRTVSKSSKYEDRKSKILSKKFAKFYSQLQSERKDSMEQNRTLRNTLDLIDKNINEEISEIRETSSKELENLRLDLAAIVDQNSRLQCENESLVKINEKLNNRICKVQNFANSISLEIKQYLGENGRLSSELEFEKKCSAEFYKDVESKREEIKELEINNYELGEEIRNLKSKIAILESEKKSNCKTKCSSEKIEAFTFNLDNLFERIRDILNVDSTDNELFRFYNIQSSTSHHKINGDEEEEERIDETQDPIVMPVIEVKENSSNRKSNDDDKNCSNFMKLKAVFEEMQLQLDSTLVRNKTLEKNLEMMTNRYSEEYDKRCDTVARLRKEMANLRDNLNEKNAQLEMLHSLNQNLDKNLFRAEIAITDCKKFNDSSTLIVQNPTSSSLSIVDNEESILESSARYIRVLEKSCRGPLVLLKCNEDSVTLCNLFEESSIDLEGLSLEVFQIDFCNEKNQRDQKYSLISQIKFGDSDQIEAGCIMDVKIQIFPTLISEDASDRKELSDKKNSPKLLPKRSKIQLVDTDGEIASLLVVEMSDTNFHSKKLNILTKGLNTIWKRIRRIN
ncbi:MAG: hypothetical protein MHMPM18_004470 [Marteilia pararefringens]